MEDIVIIDPDTGMALDDVERLARDGIEQDHLWESEDGGDSLAGSRDPRIQVQLRQLMEPKQYCDARNVSRNRVRSRHDRLLVRTRMDIVPLGGGAATYSIDGSGVAFEAALELDGDTVRATLRRASFDLRHGHSVARVQLVVLGPDGRLASFDFNLGQGVETHPRLEERTVPFRSEPDRRWTAYLRAFGEETTTA